jgi:two-component system response regulator CpxR
MATKNNPDGSTCLKRTQARAAHYSSPLPSAPRLAQVLAAFGSSLPRVHATFEAVRLLLIDDDTELCSLLVEFLKGEGFTVECVHDGHRGLDRALHGGFSLIILDVMLPGLDGFEILRRLRKESRVPVLMLTARGDDVDRIVGLDLGADDYLPKPFNPRELVARVRAIMRRYEPRTTTTAARVEVNGVVLDPATRKVTVEGREADLTTFEFDILELLMRAAGRVLSRDDLMENLYNRKATAFDRSIDMHISHIRRKLETSRPFIKTIRSIGYQFLREPGDGVEE